MRVTQFNLVDVRVANFQSFGGCDSTAHKSRCTDDESFRNGEPWNDFVWFRVDEPLKGEVGDLRLAQRVRILWLQDGQWKRCVVLLQELQLGNHGVCLPSNGLHSVCDKVFHRNQADLVIVNIKCIWAAAHLIPIPGTRYYYVNNNIDLVMFNPFWPTPPEAEGDMQTDDDDARPEEYCRNQNASVVDEDKEDKEEEEDEDEEEHNNEGYEKVRSPQGIRCPIAPTLPRFCSICVNPTRGNRPSTHP